MNVWFFITIVLVSKDPPPGVVSDRSIHLNVVIETDLAGLMLEYEQGLLPPPHHGRPMRLKEEVATFLLNALADGEEATCNP